MVEKLFIDPFQKKMKNEHISGSIIYSYIQFVLILCQVKGYLKILRLRYRSLVFTSYKAFLKTRGLELVSNKHLVSI